MIITDNHSIAEKIKLLRVHGSREKYLHKIIGFNSRLDEIQAAILRVKLKYLEKWNQKRRENAKIYNNFLEGFVEVPYCEEFNRHIYHLYTIKCKNRDKLKKYLEDSGITTSIYYPLSLHLQKAYKNLNYKKGDFKVSEKMQNIVLSLPMYPELTEEQIEFICKKIKDFYKNG
jgi:dTDP-4-amino-4,6-dideoxygalactose transaminase